MSEPHQHLQTVETTLAELCLQSLGVDQLSIARFKLILLHLVSKHLPRGHFVGGVGELVPVRDNFPERVTLQKRDNVSISVTEQLLQLFFHFWFVSAARPRGENEV